MEGMDEIRSNLAAMVARMRQEVRAAADESAQLLQSYSKATAPFTDRTTHLRNSIEGSFTVSSESARIVLSASKEYAPFVELGTSRARPYAFLWPSVAANTDNVLGIFKRHLQL